MNFYAAIDVLYCDLVHAILMKYVLSDYFLLLIILMIDKIVVLLHKSQHGVMVLG